MFEPPKPVGYGTPLHQHLDAVAHGVPLDPAAARCLTVLGYADTTVTPPVLTAEGTVLLEIFGPYPDG